MPTFNKYKNMTYQELIYQLNENIWNNLNLNDQTKILNELVLKIQKDMCDILPTYLGNTVLINPKSFINYNIIVKIQTEDSNVLGRYNQDTHTLSINKDIFHRTNNFKLINSISRLPYVLAHEVKHAFQDFIIENRNPFTRDYVDLLQSYRNNTDIKINCFGILGSGNLHINPIDDELYNEGTQMHNIDGKRQEIEALSNMFYNLNVMEREAFIFGEEKGNEFIKYCNDNKIGNFNIDETYNKIPSELTLFCDKYFCHQNETQEILATIDDCFKIIATSDGNIENILKSNIGKIDDLKANIIYDIACFALFYANDEIKDEQTRKENGDKIIELLDDYKKTENLYNCGYASTYATLKYNARCGDYIIIPTIESTKHYFYTTTLDMFNSLSDEQKKNNPLLVLKAATILKGSILDYIDIDAIQSYCRQNIDEILKTPQYQEALSIIDNDLLTELLSTKENDIIQKKKNGIDEMQKELNIDNLNTDEKLENEENTYNNIQIYNEEYTETDDNNYCYYQEYDDLDNDDMEL